MNTASFSNAPMTEDELKIRSNQQALLVEVNLALAAASDEEAVLGQILTRLRDRAGLARAAIYLFRPDERTLRCVAESGEPAVDVRRAWALDGPGLLARVAREREAIYVLDTIPGKQGAPENPVARSEYALPLLRGGSLLGVLYTASNQPDSFRAATRKLVDFIAVQTALALERSELDRQVKVSGERFRSVFEQEYFGVALCSLEGGFFAVNAAFAHLLGHEPDELRDKLYADLVHPEDRERARECSKSLRLGARDHVTLTHRFIRKTGETLWCTAVISMIRDATGRPAYMLAMVENTSDRKEAEEERALLREQLSQAQKMEAVGSLAGGLAHDLNNLLGVIMGFASLARLRMTPEDPIREPIQMIEQSAESAADLTQRLLELARHEKRRREPISLGDVLDRVLKIVTRTFDRRIRIATRFATELPSVEADAHELDHAILNLCINARDAMPEGGTLTLGASVVNLGPQDPLRPPECSPGEYVRIAVEDTGLGMEPEVKAHLFEPFFTTKGPGRGSGLGLAMVYRIVTNYKGFVHAESEVVRGSKLSLYLPAVHPPPQPFTQKLPAEVQEGSGTVLVVDDEPMVLAFAERGLEKLGYRVLTAESGRRACEIYASRAQEIDCVLLDMVMPEISGFETYRKLREINPQVKVILSSGYSVEGVARNALEMGAADFIGKPYTLETLSRVLKKAHSA